MSGPRHADRPSHTDPNAVLGGGSGMGTAAVVGTVTAPNPDALEVAPGTQHEAIQGWVPELASEDDLRVALEKAFDYRGDVTITLKNGAKLEGYIFDRIAGSDLRSSFARVIPADGSARQKICYAEIAALAFTGRDTAAGKSWEAWIKKYWEKKSAGHSGIRIEPEALE
jgi:hypothetical protein